MINAIVLAVTLWLFLWKSRTTSILDLNIAPPEINMAPEKSQKLRFGKSFFFQTSIRKGSSQRFGVWRQMGTKVTWYLSQTLKNYGSYQCPLCSCISDPHKKTWSLRLSHDIFWAPWNRNDMIILEMITCSAQSLVLFSWFQLTLGAHYPLSKSILWPGSFVGWSRVCRPGTVHGSQQQYLVNLEPCAMKFWEEINHV